MTDEKVLIHKCPDKRRYWQQHISTWQQSGQSQAAYCRRHGLKPHQMTYWKQRLAQAEANVSFVPVKLSSHLPVPVKPASLRVHTPNGYRIDVPAGFDTNVLKQVVIAVHQL